MQGERNWSLELRAQEVAQRAVMLQVLREDHDERWCRAELEREIFDIAPLEISDALERLSREGLVHIHSELVLASRAARHLDDLGMFSI